MGSADWSRHATRWRPRGSTPLAIEVFTHYYRLVESGETGMIPESTIEPVDMEALADVEVAEEVGAEASATRWSSSSTAASARRWAWTGPSRCSGAAAGSPSSTSSPARCWACARSTTRRLPLIFMDSFRTTEDTLAALARYDDLRSTTCRWTSCRTRSPSSSSRTSRRRRWPDDPSLEWCPPGHGDLYTALRRHRAARPADRGRLHAGVRVELRQPRCGPGPAVAGWFAPSGAPFAIEAVRRTPSDRKGGHFAGAARRRSDRASRDRRRPLPEDMAALADSRPAPVLLDQQPVVRPRGDATQARRRDGCSASR